MINPQHSWEMVCVHRMHMSKTSDTDEEGVDVFTNFEYMGSAEFMYLNRNMKRLREISSELQRYTLVFEGHELYVIARSQEFEHMELYLSCGKHQESPYYPWKRKDTVSTGWFAYTTNKREPFLFFTDKTFADAWALSLEN